MRPKSETENSAGVKAGIILAIETSCDETAVAILDGDELRAHEVFSQVESHRDYGGVVPEVASRNHLAILPALLERATARVPVSEIDTFAATGGPGLASSLLVGNSVAKGLALGAGKPFLAINHLEGHLLSAFFPDPSGANENERAIPAHVGLIASGGHTLLVNVRATGDYEILGRTRDDAAGEAFDKVAKLIGLGYPGGPEIERMAAEGDGARFDLPRSMLDSRDLNFSFSGLKTAVRYLLPKIDLNDRQTLHDLCASFQQAVIDVLREKSLAALRSTGRQLLALSGGVACNEALRKNLAVTCAQQRVDFRVAPPWLTTDNAAMIAFAAQRRRENGLSSSLASEIDPNLALA